MTSIDLTILVCGIHTRYDTFLPRIQSQLFGQNDTKLVRDDLQSYAENRVTAEANIAGALNQQGIVLADLTRHLAQIAEKIGANLT